MSNGIGNWLGCLENLSNLAIICNCATVYFTSQTYKDMFTDPDGDKSVGAQEILGFTMWVVLVEHVLLALKLLIESMIDDVPAGVQRGERERSDLILNYKRNKEKDHVTCRIEKAFETIKNSKVKLGAWKPI